MQINANYSLLAINKGLEICGIAPGERFLATVLAQEGETYFLEKGNQRLQAFSQIPLQVGQKLILALAGHGEGQIFLKVLGQGPEIPGKDRKLEQIKLQLQKMNLLTEKTLAKVLDASLQLPVDDRNVLRYLLDPHLLAALFLPQEGTADSKQYYFEILNYHNGQNGGQQDFEIGFQGEFSELGSIQVKLKYFQSYLYLHFWAQKPATESLLKEKIRELNLPRCQMAVLPSTSGPLLSFNPLGSIDCII